MYWIKKTDLLRNNLKPELFHDNINPSTFYAQCLKQFYILPLSQQEVGFRRRRHLKSILKLVC